MEITIDIDSVCRICLKEGELKSIHQNFENSTTYIEKINKFFNYEIILNSKVPDKICCDCIFLLKSACKFKIQVEETEDLLKKNFDLINDHCNYDENAGAGAVLSEDSNDCIIHNDNDEKKHEINFISDDETKVQNSFDEDNLEDDYYEETKVITINNLRADFRRMMTQDKLKMKLSQEKVMHYLKTKQLDVQPSRRKIDTDLDILDEQNVELIKSSKRRKSIATKKEPKDNNRLNLGYSCEVSGKTFSESILAKRHMRVQKKEKQIALISDCDNRIKREGIQSGAANKSEKKDRHSSEPMICEICGNKYKTNKVLESHMRRHRNERPFKCEICGKGFVINIELARHMRVHTGEKPYACMFCGRKFSDYGSRIKHERTHTGERPYKCDIDGCNKAFAYSHALKTHNLVHSGVKAFECALCQKKFSTARHLKCHMNTLIHKNR